MADKVVTGEGAYGTVHVMEEEMRAAKQGVFEDKSGETRKRKAAKAPETKAETGSPENKSVRSKVIGANGLKATTTRTVTAGKKGK